MATAYMQMQQCYSFGNWPFNGNISNSAYSAYESMKGNSNKNKTGATREDCIATTQINGIQGANPTEAGYPESPVAKMPKLEVPNIKPANASHLAGDSSARCKITFLQGTPSMSSYKQPHSSFCQWF